MLTFFRKHATNWLIKVALFLIVIVFVFWGGYSYQAQKATRLARVGDHYISVAEYNESYNQLLNFYRNRFGEAFSEDVVRQLNLKEQALQNLVQRYALVDLAQKMGLDATVEEVQRQILDLPAFQGEEGFDHKRYVSLLRRNRMSPEAFESQMALSLTLQKVEDFVRRQAVVTDEEVRTRFERDYTPIRVAWAMIAPDSVKDEIVDDNETLEKYYEEHKARYKSDEKRKFDFVLFEKAYEKEEASEEEILAYYEDHPEQFEKKAEVKARHILFRLPEDASEEQEAQAREKALKVLEEARGGADFAELAKEHSQEPGAKERGGDLGWFAKERMVPAFSEAAFSMEKGEIGDLVRTRFGIHIIKVEDKRPAGKQPLEEVRTMIEYRVKRSKAAEKARRQAEDFADLAYAEGDVGEAAAEEGLEVVSTTDFISSSDKVEGVTISPRNMNELFSLADGAISPVLEFPGNSGVAQVRGVKPPENLPFEEARERVKKDFAEQKAKELAEEKAKALLTLAKERKSLEEAAKEEGIEVEKTEWFSRKDPAKDLTIAGPELDLLFRLNEENPFPEAPVGTREGFAVCQFLGGKAPDEQKLEENREALRRQIRMMKENQLWQSWMDARMKEADVEQLQEL